MCCPDIWFGERQRESASKLPIAAISIRYEGSVIKLAYKDVKYYRLTIQKAATRYGLKESTLRDALKRYKFRGTPLPAKRGRKPKAIFSRELVSIILNQVDENPSLSIEGIHSAIEENGTTDVPSVTALQK
ncbi:hypothetical protein BDA99DRAFT_540983 [Phascolomyces articulosus]|uniref:Uncharacterized protein n=1 Tax=Phascolomyces articulosus TaxID=60185 RepID=A0AAD5K6J8_9FUNG|nr:hypothetical protein BDA99DRAFT_540983 [Phascolomyces articulosus]